MKQVKIVVHINQLIPAVRTFPCNAVKVCRKRMNKPDRVIKLKYRLDLVSHNQIHESFFKILQYVKSIKIKRNYIGYKLATKNWQCTYYPMHEALQKPRGSSWKVLSIIGSLFQQFCVCWTLFIWSRQVILWMQSIFIKIALFSCILNS